MTSAAIYARVSSARQKKDETIASQTAALRAHAEQLGLEVPEEWVFEDEGHSGATLVRPGAGAAARPGRRGRHRRGAVLLAGPAGPQVRLPGPADRGVRPRGHPGGVRQGPARRHARKISCWCSSRACSPSTRRRRSWNATGAARPTAPGPGRSTCSPGPRSATATSRKSDHAGAAYEIVEHEAALVAELFRRYADDGASIADLARWLTEQRRAHPHRQAPLGPLRGLGHAAQPRLRRARGVRQDHGRRTSPRA